MGAAAGVHTADMGIEHKLRRLRLNPITHNGVTLTEGSPNLITGLGAGTPTVAAEIETGLEITGINLDTADELYYLVDVPAELDLADLDKDLWVELVFTSNKATAHGSIDFKAFAKGIALGAVLSDVLSTPDASVVFPAQSVAATRKVCKAMMPLGAAGAFKDDELLGIVVELDDKGDGAADETVLISARLAYTPEICDPEGVARST